MIKMFNEKKREDVKARGKEGKIQWEVYIKIVEQERERCGISFKGEVMRNRILTCKDYIEIINK